ncbi:MAG: hypothetical protein ACYDEB_15155, partial [Dehalococcoidia bacterium]
SSSVWAIAFISGIYDDLALCVKRGVIDVTHVVGGAVPDAGRGMALAGVAGCWRTWLVVRQGDEPRGRS